MFSARSVGVRNVLIISFPPKVLQEVRGGQLVENPLMNRQRCSRREALMCAREQNRELAASLLEAG